MELSDKIKSIREGKRIKLSEVADAIGIDVSNYAKIEKKGNKLTLERIEQIAHALKVPVIEILDSQYAAHLNQKIQDLETENADLRKTIDQYQPVITMVEFMMNNPTQTEELADRATKEKIGKSDIEEMYPELKQIFENPIHPTDDKRTR